jgi:hypothetical protein
LLGETEHIGHQIGFQQRFAAEEAKFQDAAGRQGADGTANGGTAHVGPHDARELPAGIAIVTAQIAGVGGHQHEMKSLVLHRLLRQKQRWKKSGSARAFQETRPALHL